MSDRLMQLAERIRQNAAERQTLTDEAAANPSTFARVRAGTFTAGDRVLDVPTGLHGAVDGAGLPDGLRRNDVRVLLEDGRAVVRSPDALLFRPPPPRAHRGKP